MDADVLNERTLTKSTSTVYSQQRKSLSGFRSDGYSILIMTILSSNWDPFMCYSGFGAQHLGAQRVQIMRHNVNANIVDATPTIVKRAV